MLRLRGKVQGKNFSGLAVHLFSFKKTFKNNFLIIGMQSWNGYVVSADFCALSPIHEAWKRMWGWFQTLYHFSSSLSGKKWTWKHTRAKNWNCCSKSQNQNWARVIRKIFYGLFRYLNLILGTWNQKLIQNSWSIEAKILQENLEIQASFKVRFLRWND